MTFILNFANSFWMQNKAGDLCLYKFIGPFESHKAAKLWLLRNRAVLDAANAGDVSIDVLDSPADI